MCSIFGGGSVLVLGKTSALTSRSFSLESGWVSGYAPAHGRGLSHPLPKESETLLLSPQAPVVSVGSPWGRVLTLLMSCALFEEGILHRDSFWLTIPVEIWHSLFGRIM